MNAKPRKFWRCPAGTKHYLVNEPENPTPDTVLNFRCRCVYSFFKVYPDATSIWDLRSLGPGPPRDATLYRDLESE